MVPGNYRGAGRLFDVLDWGSVDHESLSVLEVRLPSPGMLNTSRRSFLPPRAGLPRGRMASLFSRRRTCTQTARAFQEP